MSRPLEVLLAFTRLGFTSFGGPIAHLGYFREELVRRRSWVSEETYADLVALCQFLPGPASSQVGMALGIERAGLLGGVAAWVGFTLPSAAIMTALALGFGRLGPGAAPWIHGLLVFSVVVVGLAVWGMATTLCPDRPRALIGAAAAVSALLVRSPWAHVGIIASASLLGWLVLGERRAPASESLPARALRERRGGAAGHALAVPYSRKTAIAALVAFFALLAGLPLAAPYLGTGTLVAEKFYRAGSLVFGGGHVVLPLLQTEFVGAGWTTDDAFLAGYGAAQAMPGPLFSFAAYLGAILNVDPRGVAGAALGLVAIYVPSYLLVVGSLPFWEVLRSSPRSQAALRGANAAVVGILGAALYDPVFTSAIHSPKDVALAIAGWAALVHLRVPPWAAVIGSAVIAGTLF